MAKLAKAHFAVAPGTLDYSVPFITCCYRGYPTLIGVTGQQPHYVAVPDHAYDYGYKAAAKLAKRYSVSLVVYRQDIPF